MTRSVSLSLRAILLTGALLLPCASSAQISPGELSRDHRSLEGPLNCRSCHAGKAEEMDRNCLSCHQDIRQLREQKRGFHAQNGSAPCASCHPDHAGHDFELIAWDGGSFEKFDHAKAGWLLAGKHAKAACRDCHQPKHQSAEFMKLSKREDPTKSWVGLDTACASCHEDTHRGALGPDCAAASEQA
jgi:nitrate/TMAO reductase-like tetraheme cytochrome c subunit